MAPSTHSTFSASSSYRLLACPGSYALSMAADDGKRRSSKFSAEGTLAHAISEVCLHTGIDASALVGTTRPADGFEFEVDEDMAEHVMSYVNHVRGLTAMGYLVMLEVRVDPTVQWDGLAPLEGVNLFGTSDVVAFHPEQRDLRIVDLKYGQGVPVDVTGNTQLLYYAAGAMSEAVLKDLCVRSGRNYLGVDNVTMTIVQPRARHRDGPVRWQTLPAADVRAWARDTLYPGVVRALEDQGQSVFCGSHCRFCPVLSACEAPKDHAMELARQAFLAAPPVNLPAAAPSAALLAKVTLSDDALADLLVKSEIIGPWIASLERLAHERLTEGHSLPGWKLVQKRPSRQWVDEELDAIEAALAASGAPEEVFGRIAVKSLISPAQAEKRLGKPVYNEHIAPLVARVSSGTTIAPELDPRSVAARQTAQEAFGLPTHSKNQQP